jgi:hypothetical protein
MDNLNSFLMVEKTIIDEPMDTTLKTEAVNSSKTLAPLYGHGMASSKPPIFIK